MGKGDKEVAGGSGTPGKFKRISDSTENSGKPKGNRASRLRAGVVQVVRKTFNKGSKGEKKNEPKPQAKEKPHLVAPRTMTIEEIQPRLENAIKKNLPHDIIYLITNNHKTINKEFDSGATDFMELILQAAYVEDKSTGKTASNIVKEKNNLIFSEVVQYAFKKLIESGSRLYQLDRESAIKRQKSFFKLTHFEETDEIYKEQQDNLAKSCPNLTDLDYTPSIEESHLSVINSADELKNLENVMPAAGEVKNTKGETHVAERSGNPFTNIKRITLTKLPEWNHKEASDAQTEPKTPPVAASRPSLLKDLNQSDSDTDSGIDSPTKAQDSQKKHSESTPNSRMCSLSSSTESLNLLTHLTKTRPKGPSKRSPPSKRHYTTPLEKTKNHARKGGSIKLQQTLSSGGSNKGIPFEKQQNNKKSYATITAGCAILAVCCFAAAGLYFMSEKEVNSAISTSSIVTVEALCAIGIVFAIAAVATWCLTPASELSPTNVTSFSSVSKNVI
jgi:hypothetical protein